MDDGSPSTSSRFKIQDNIPLCLYCLETLSRSAFRISIPEDSGVIQVSEVRENVSFDVSHHAFLSSGCNHPCLLYTQLQCGGSWFENNRQIDFYFAVYCGGF